MIGGVLSSFWPTGVVVLAVVALILAWCVYAPPYAFLGALVLYSFEGSIKVRLTVEGAPSPLAIGAGLLDFVFLASLASLLVWDRGRSLSRLWKLATGRERVAGALFAAWFGLSVLQITFSGDLVQGLEGFRLTQFYVPAVLGGIVVASRLGAERLAPALLGVAFLATAYAALRGIVGPSFHEQTFAELRTFHTEFGEFGRNVGSFTAPFSLASFLVPVAITCMVLGFLVPNLRRIAWALFALAMVGIIASYVRTAFLAVVVGAAVLAVLVLLAGEGTGRRKAYALGLVVLVLGGGYGATLLAGELEPEARERAQSLASPFDDQSLTTRLDTWEGSLDRVADQPLGAGLGTVGRASLVGRRATTTDSSYLKILEEQGLLGALLFLGGWGGIVLAVAGRVARIGPTRCALGAAALAGFSGFAVLMLMGEYIEQPGKLLAWTLLGVAIWEAVGGQGERGTASPSLRSSLTTAWRLPRRALALLAACCLVALLASAVVTASREQEFRSSSTLVLPQAGVPDPEQNAARAANLVEARLEDPITRLGVVEDIDYLAPSEVPSRVAVATRRMGERWEFRLTASGPTPREARALAEGSVPVFTVLGVLHNLFVSRTESSRLRRTLRTGRLEPTRRQTLRRQLRLLARDELKPTARPSVATSPPQSGRLADKLGQAVAAKASPVPNAAWALTAALLFALAAAGALLLPALRPHAGLFK